MIDMCYKKQPNGPVQLGWELDPCFSFFSVFCFTLYSCSPISALFARVGVEGFALIHFVFTIGLLCCFLLVSFLFITARLPPQLRDEVYV